jgi:hypothetical protein
LNRDKQELQTWKEAMEAEIVKLKSDNELLQKENERLQQMCAISDRSKKPSSSACTIS